jgi:hypothetical protein
MKKVLVFLMVAGLTTMVTFGQETETCTVSDFTGIDASGVFSITVTKGDTASLAIEANENVLPCVRSEVKNGVLHLLLECRDVNKNIKVKTLKAAVVMKDLNNVKLSGACKITVTDLFTPTDFTGNCSGTAKMAINLNTEQLNLKSGGASKIQIKANVTGNIKIDAYGASKIQGELKTDSIELTSRGTNNIDLTGSAADIVVDMAGVSYLKADNFTVKTADIKLAGGSKVMIDVTDTLNVKSAGASVVRYKGEPAIKVSSNGASKVKKIE